MPYSSSSIEIDINNQINEFQEEREAFVEKQQSPVFSETLNEEDDETKKNYDDDTGVDDECLNPMNTRVTIDVASLPTLE